MLSGCCSKKPTGAVEMPYVNIRITREGATAEQKAKLIHGVTKLLEETLGKNPKTTVVVIDEVEMDNWGIGGIPVEAFRKTLT
jgi:4-oxalocrotonate tautomerase